MVHREEIYDMIRDQNRLAARQSPADLAALKSLWRAKTPSPEPIERTHP